MFLDPTSTTAQNGPLEWFLKWIAALGWPLIIAGIWKLRGWLGGVEKKIEDTVETIKANGGSIKLVSDDLKKFKEFFEVHIKEDEASFRAIREIVSDHAKAVGTAPQDIKALSDAVHHQAEVNCGSLQDSSWYRRATGCPGDQPDEHHVGIPEGRRAAYFDDEGVVYGRGKASGKSPGGHRQEAGNGNLCRRWCCCLTTGRDDTRRNRQDTRCCGSGARSWPYRSRRWTRR